MKYYGTELIIDMNECDLRAFNRTTIREFFREVCRITEMKGEDIHFWDDYGVPKGKKQTDPQTMGTTAIQFILTSNITIHTLNAYKSVLINFFSCKSYNPVFVEAVATDFFGGQILQSETYKRYR